jgi:hypothetical protein
MSEILRVAEVMARIEERVPELAGRLASAGAFAQVVANGQLPQQTPAGFVLHGGLNGGKAQLAAGHFGRIWPKWCWLSSASAWQAMRSVIAAWTRSRRLSAR